MSKEKLDQGLNDSKEREPSANAVKHDSHNVTSRQNKGSCSSLD